MLMLAFDKPKSKDKLLKLRGIVQIPPISDGSVLCSKSKNQKIKTN